jgi:hypothetical protein
MPVGSLREKLAAIPLPLNGLNEVLQCQRKEPLASSRFLAAQFDESWGRSAAVGVGRQSPKTNIRNSN